MIRYLYVANFCGTVQRMDDCHGINISLRDSIQAVEDGLNGLDLATLENSD